MRCGLEFDSDPRLHPELERSQEVDEVLLFPSFQLIEMVNDLVRLAVFAPVSLDGLHQIAGPPIVEEKNSLSDTPERSRPELIGACGTLRYAVRKASAHMVDEEIGEEIHCLVRKRGARARRRAAGNHLAGRKRRCMAVDTTYLCEKGSSIHGGRRVGRRCGRGQHSHEVGKRLDI